MNWFTRLFRRKPKEVPPKRTRWIIGRQAGQKRNKVHVYPQLFLYPIRLCDWVVQDEGDIERLVPKIEELPTRAKAIDYFHQASVGFQECKHCRALLKGRRGPLMIVFADEMGAE